MGAQRHQFSSQLHFLRDPSPHRGRLLRKEALWEQRGESRPEGRHQGGRKLGGRQEGPRSGSAGRGLQSAGSQNRTRLTRRRHEGFIVPVKRFLCGPTLCRRWRGCRELTKKRILLKH